MLEDSKIVRKVKSMNDYETEYTIQGMQDLGRMLCLDVYPGVQVIYNYFHSFQSPPHRAPDTRHIEINHCLRGRYESLFYQQYYAYLGEGDLAVSKWSIDRKHDGFPLGYYEGIEILIDVCAASKNKIFREFHIDIERLEQKLAQCGDLCVMRATSQIQHICLEMYEVDQEMRLDYLKIKVLELLVFLYHNDFQMIENQRRYYPKSQVEKIKDIQRDMMAHLSDAPDMEALAEKYHINLHTLRKEFREIYGVPIYQWFKEYRLEQSLRLLAETEMPIIDIANRIGYSNPSKYAQAFKKYMDMTPGQYRKSHIRMD